MDQIIKDSSHRTAKKMQPGWEIFSAYLLPFGLPVGILAEPEKIINNQLKRSLLFILRCVP